MRPAHRLSAVRAFARRPVRLLLATIALLAVAAARPTASRALPPAVAPSGAIAHLLPEVRLRKLHLVRPDLIPYPLCYEVYC